MGAVERSIDVDVAVEDFYRVISDFGAYRNFVSDMRDVRVGPREGNRVEATYTLEIDAGVARRSVSYTLAHEEDPPRGLRWSLMRGDLMKSNSGSWRLERLDDRRTRATYSIDISFGLLVPRAISNFLTERNLPKMLEEFKQRAESLAGR